MILSEIQHKLHSRRSNDLVGKTFSTKYIMNDYYQTTHCNQQCFGREDVEANFEQLRTIDIKWQIIGINIYEPVYQRYSNSDGSLFVYLKNGELYSRKWNGNRLRYDYIKYSGANTGLHLENDTATAQLQQVVITSNDSTTHSLQGVFSKYSSDYTQSTVRAWLNAFDERWFFMEQRKPYRSNGFLLKHLKDMMFLKAICPVYIRENQWDYISLPSLKDIGHSIDDVNNHCRDSKLQKRIVCDQFQLNKCMCWMLRDSVDQKTVTVREDGLLELNSLEDFDNIAPICTIQ